MELAYTMVLEAIAARIESSSLSGGTKEFKSQTVSWSETGWLHTEQEQLDLAQF